MGLFNFAFNPGTIRWAKIGKTIVIGKMHKLQIVLYVTTFTFYHHLLHVVIKDLFCYSSKILKCPDMTVKKDLKTPISYKFHIHPSAITEYHYKGIKSLTPQTEILPSPPVPDTLALSRNVYMQDVFASHELSSHTSEPSYTNPYSPSLLDARISTWPGNRLLPNNHRSPAYIGPIWNLYVFVADTLEKFLIPNDALLCSCECPIASKWP